MNAYAAYDRAEYIRDTRELQQIGRDEWVRERADEINDQFPVNLSDFASPFKNSFYRMIIANSELQELYAEFADRASVVLAEAEAKENELLYDNYSGVA